MGTGLPFLLHRRFWLDGPWLEPDPTTHTFAFLRPCRERNEAAEGPPPSPWQPPHTQALPLRPWPPPPPCPQKRPLPGGLWLSPGAPTTPIRQKTRFKIRDAKCQLRPRSHEPAKETSRQLLLGEWATLVPTYTGLWRSPCLGAESQGPGGLGLQGQSLIVLTTMAPQAQQPCLAHCRQRRWPLGRLSAGSAKLGSPASLPHPGLNKLPRAELSVWLCPMAGSSGLTKHFVLQ